MTRLLYAAAALLLLSWAPLVVVGLSDPTANPIGLGLLGLAGTALSALLAIAAIVVGLLRVLRRG